MLEKGMMTTKATTVIDYIVQRIADEGVEHCFGVPGDYAFPVGDAVDRNPNIKWIGCSNELNASYAASRALTRLSRRRHAVVSEPAVAQNDASHSRRRNF
jgi:TPP-dependent 2-oxoacid decarboxylase